MQTVPVLDFSHTPLANDYPPGALYVKVLDDVFTANECKALIHFAETGVFDLHHPPSTPTQPPPHENPWQQAGLGMDQHIVDKRIRNSQRILRYDDQVATFVHQRMLPYIPEIMEIGPGDKWYGIVSDKTEKHWRMMGVNDRLSFLKYSPGHFFKEHLDGQLELPDGRKAQITIQIYLNGSSTGTDEIVGGRTRIWSYDRERWCDVEPRMGRVLVFEQAKVLHSGEKLRKGVKYTLRCDLLFGTR